MTDSNSKNGTERDSTDLKPIRLSDEAIKSGMDALGHQAFEGFKTEYETPDTLTKRIAFSLVKITGTVAIAALATLFVQEALPSVIPLMALAKDTVVNLSTSIR